MKTPTRQEAIARAARARAALHQRTQNRRGAAPFAKVAKVEVVVAPQLFETPPELAARVIELAHVQPGHEVLEPSAGGGRLLRALESVSCIRLAVEENAMLANALLREFPAATVWCEDFLAFARTTPRRFDRIVMNPPFVNGADIRHVLAALTLLKPNGRLVAIVAGGPRQERALRSQATHWETLPDGTFAAVGTQVRTVLCAFDEPRERHALPHA